MADDETHRRKRRRVAPENRKRVNIACCNCRRLKEKCNGEMPCERCVKHNRTCSTQTIDDSSTTDSDNDVERTRLLEAVARHFLGDAPLDVPSLRQLVDGPPGHGRFNQYETDQQPSPAATASPSNDSNREVNRADLALDNAAFVKRLHDHVRLRTDESVFAATTADNPNPRMMNEMQLDFDIATLPPQEVAMILASTYFELGQPITKFVEYSWLDSRFDRLYDSSFTPDVKDAGWLCSVLVVLAIGAQHSHVPSAREPLPANRPHGSQEEGDDGISASRNLYRAATALVPNLVYMVDVEAAQAWLLLGRFALGYNAGVAMTYLEICISITGRCTNSIGDGRLQKDEERRRHIFEVAIVWCRHLAVSSGCQIKSRARISGCAGGLGRFSTKDYEFSPLSMMQGLTDWLCKVAAQIRGLQSRSGADLVSSMKDLIATKKDYKMWWSSTSYSQKPPLQLNRTSSHLRLLHYLNLISLGRPFVFASMRRAHHKGFVADPSTPCASLVEDEYSAYGIVDICSLLDQSDGLSRFDYVEYSSCYAALSFLVTQGLGYRCRLFRNKVEVGMQLLKKLAPEAEYLELEALDRKVQNIVLAEADRGAGRDRRASAPTYSTLSQWLRMSARRRDDCAIGGSGDTIEPSLLNGIDWSGMELTAFDFTTSQPEGDMLWSELGCFSPLARDQAT